VNALKVRAVLGKKEWGIPARFGPDGWRLVRLDRTASVIVSTAEIDGAEWVHASIAHHDQTTPAYDELVTLHRAVFGAGWAYQLFAPPTEHINIHAYALHLWGRLDGAAVLPNFGAGGSI
jgi:hypothetical protein